MNVFNKFIEEIPREDRVTIILEYKVWAKTGILKDGVLRKSSKELGVLVGNDAMIFAKDIVNIIAIDFAMEVIEKEK